MWEFFGNLPRLGRLHAALWYGPPNGVLSSPGRNVEPVHPRRIVGRYALFDEIASGGMATVHYGRLLGPVGFSRTVAIKRLHPEYARDPEFVSMFVDEARLAARIRHPNVVATLDVIAEEGELFLVMDYVLGAPLSAIMYTAQTKGQRVPPRIAAGVMSGVLQGLHAAHEATDEAGTSLGIVHRDVSPQNILLGADGAPRVLDFGIAKAAGRTYTTRDGSVKGKIAYMAPEQLDSGVVTRGADLYAASVVLWEVLTGRRAFAGDTEAIVWMRAAEGKLPLASTVDPSLAPYDEIIRCGMARNPHERFQTGKQMALALESCDGIASQAAVADWLESVIAPVIQQRADMISSIESFSGMGPEQVRELMNSDLSLSEMATNPRSERPPDGSWPSVAAVTADSVSADRSRSQSTAVQVPRPNSSQPPPPYEPTGVPVAVPSAIQHPTTSAGRSSRGAVLAAVVVPLLLGGAAAAVLWWPGASLDSTHAKPGAGTTDTAVAATGEASQLPSATTTEPSHPNGDDPKLGDANADTPEPRGDAPTPSAKGLRDDPVVPVPTAAASATPTAQPSASAGAWDNLGGRL